MEPMEEFQRTYMEFAKKQWDKDADRIAEVTGAPVELFNRTSPTLMDAWVKAVEWMKREWEIP